MINVSAHMLSVRLPTADMSQRASVWRVCLCCKKRGQVIKGESKQEFLGEKIKSNQINA